MVHLHIQYPHFPTYASSWLYYHLPHLFSLLSLEISSCFYGKPTSRFASIYVNMRDFVAWLHLSQLVSLELSLVSHYLP